jgi:hypothetical protein
VDHGAFDLDQRIRLAAFEFLTQQTQRTPDGVLHRTLFLKGFTFESMLCCIRQGGSHVVHSCCQRQWLPWNTDLVGGEAIREGDLSSVTASRPIP